MASFPLLFDLGTLKSARPTTRGIADTVKRGGTAALTEAERRADEARYQEVTCRSALNHVDGMPFNWTLNAYRGCTHGCHYCFARRYHVQFEMNADDEFASVILVKHNFVDVLRRELDRPARKRQHVRTAPPRIRTSRSRGITSRPRRHPGVDARPAPFGLITKVRWWSATSTCSAITRGRRLHDLHERPDGRRRRVADPGTWHRPPAQRLRAVRELVDAGINTCVLMAPIVPASHQHVRRWNGPSRRLPITAPALSAATSCTRGRHPHALLGLHRPGVSSDDAQVREAVREEICA